MKLSFSGTRNGMSIQQVSTFSRLISGLHPTEFHHGACRGADAEANRIVESLEDRCHRVAHPGIGKDETENPLLDQESVENSHEVRETKGHFARNRDIVNDSDMLIACPWHMSRPAPKTGGGTWMTVEFCENVGKPVTIIWPNGSVEAKK